LSHPILVATNASQLEQMVAMETIGAIIIPETRMAYFLAYQILYFPQHIFTVIAKLGLGHFGM
jgi:hypothetical protein